jgi:hypothetical protein
MIGKQATYINWESQYGRETVDQVIANEFTTDMEYRQECKRLINEYRLAYGGRLWLSLRSIGEW